MSRIEQNRPMSYTELRLISGSKILIDSETFNVIKNNLESENRKIIELNTFWVEDGYYWKPKTEKLFIPNTSILLWIKY